jgi:hypothetical protein
MYINFRRFGFSFFNDYAGIFTIWTSGKWYFHFGVRFKEWKLGVSEDSYYKYYGLGPLLLLMKEKHNKRLAAQVNYAIGDIVSVPYGWKYEQVSDHLHLPCEPKRKNMEVLKIHKNGGLWVQDPEGEGYGLFCVVDDSYLSRNSPRMY